MSSRFPIEKISLPGDRQESVESNDSSYDAGTLESSGFPFSLDLWKIGNFGGPSAEEEPVKRRGPKPDQKPAKNEKLERNRKAQRSHRERKERYIRNLEQEVIRLREAFTQVSKDKTAIAQENTQLHALLLRNGIQFAYPGQGHNLSLLASSDAGAAGKNDGPTLQEQHSQPLQIQATPIKLVQQITPEQYSRIAINLVLALEKKCHNHMKILSTNATRSEYIHSHVLMISCPPESHTSQHPEQEWGLKTVDLEPESIVTLFNMQVLDAQRKRYLESLDGELTPMAAWTKITTHPRFSELTFQDFDHLIRELPNKVGCHGFGAVIEEFEVDDCLEKLFLEKDTRVLQLTSLFSEV